MGDECDLTGTGAAPGNGDENPVEGGNQPTGDICAFCCDSIEDSSACFSTACPLHVSHKDCLLPWLAKSRTCATCRTPVTKVTMKTGEGVLLPELEAEPEDQPPLWDESYDVSDEAIAATENRGMAVIPEFFREVAYPPPPISPLAAQGAVGLGRRTGVQSRYQVTIPYSRAAPAARSATQEELETEQDKEK